MRAIALSVFLIILTASICQAVPAPTGDWLELIDVAQLPYFKDGIVTQVSSYDRTGGNDDGFSGVYSFVRKEGEEFVIFEEQGPGCIYRIWSANPGLGRIRFYFDGEAEPRVDIPHWEEMYQGKYEPFVPPISQNFLGGWCSYVPIPFAKSCKIVAEGPVRFYQITWQKFPADRQVKTFSRDMTPKEKSKFERVKDAWSKLGENPWPCSQSARTEQTTKRISGGGKLAIADLDGPGMVRAIRIRADSPDARMFRKALIEVYTDDERKPTVWSPLGDLFLDGFGQGISQSLLIGRKDGAYYCYYPMPFESNIRIRIVNEGRANLNLDAEVVWEPLSKDAVQCMGRFFAWWHRQNPTTPGKLFPILDAQGRGHYCGVSHAMQGGGGLGFLEGDEMLWIDDRDNTKYNGTGTEDYFNGGWYFGGTGNAPLYGCGVFDDPGSRCLAFRMHFTDYVPFQQKARIGIEHGHNNEVQADYTGVTYWYATPETTHGFSPVSVDERMPQSPRVPNAIEAETAFVGGTGASIVSDAEMPLMLSAGRAVAAKSSGEPPFVTLKVEVVDSGTYALDSQLVASPNGGKVQMLVDGRAVGDPIDTQASKLCIIPFGKPADISWLRKGSHEITFKMLASGAAKYEFMVDCIRLTETGFIEAEQAKIAGSSGEPLGEQALGAPWSNGAQIWFRPAAAGAYFTLELPVEKAGAYTLYAYFTKAGDYGIVQVKLDGKPVGQPFDGYNNGVGRSERINLGPVDLTAGTHEITFEVIGKNPSSVSYMVGVDALLLR